MRAHTVRFASRSTVSPSKGLPASCTTFLSKKEKNIGQSKNQEPSERERFLQEDATEELERVGKDERAPLFSALLSV